jgi:hypothetical protein
MKEAKKQVKKPRVAKLVKKPPVKSDKCPDNPVDLCTEFMKKSVFGWQEWVLDANTAYKACCKKNPPKPPKLPRTDCTDKNECEDVCDLFKDWAKEISNWAEKLTNAVDKCFDKWQPKVRVPRVPEARCEKCGQVCHTIRRFHEDLAKWGEDIRYPLNDLCQRPGPGLVPEPPKPPF